ncbi:hypothetical protein GOM49_12300 [Clostridium bovifaecis]|uniref:Pilus assembly protein PilO n=1 Tax=Clostridium bovifaecis TaxID=2184719 RepID=A0A6I6ETX8_9CLOT|nr:hypothetical protein GOM49_12300 [Clostridium bovifaecis]
MIKLTKREKILVIVLIVVIFFAAYYQFVFRKQISKIKDLQQIRQNNQLQINKQANNKILIKKLQSDLNNKNTKIRNNTEKFFPSITQEKIILILNEAIIDSDIGVQSMSFSQPNIEKLSKEKSLEKNKDRSESYIKSIIDEYKSQSNGNSDVKNGNEPKENSQTKEELQLNAEKMTVNISYKASYESVIEFIHIIKSYKNTIVISNISMNSNGDKMVENETDKYEVSGNITLELYAIPKLLEENGDYEEWENSGIYGKNNPFKEE